MSTRRAWIVREDALALSRQCALAGVARSWVYEGSAGAAVDALDLRWLGLIDEQYTAHPFYGSRRRVIYLQQQGHTVNRKHVRRLMRVLGLVGMAPGPATSTPHPEHKIYPYLLRGVAVTRPNHVWSTDITYIRLAHGFANRVAIIDGYSRRVLAWRLSNTLEAGFCVDCLEDALRVYGRPTVFNTDQGVAVHQHGIHTGPPGRSASTSAWTGVGGRWTTSSRTVKHEDVYIKGYASLPELLLGLTEYFAFYNGERPHQSLDYRTPDEVHIGRGPAAGPASSIGSATAQTPWWRRQRERQRSAGGLRVDKA